MAVPPTRSVLAATLDRLRREPGVALLPGADDAALSWVQGELADSDLPGLPAAAADVLRATNGLAWNGIEIYGTEEVQDRHSEFVLPDLVSVNEDIAEDDPLGLFTGRLVVGRSDEAWYVYDQTDDRFLVVDLTTLAAMDSYPTLSDLLAAEVSVRMTFLQPAD